MGWLCNSLSRTRREGPPASRYGIVRAPLLSSKSRGPFVCFVPLLWQLAADQPLDALKALVEAELNVPKAEQVLLKDGNPLPATPGASLSAVGLVSGDLLFLMRDRRAAQVKVGDLREGKLSCPT